MGKNTGITWTDHTFNPWWGCIRVSEGCTHCYAETFSKRMGLDIWGPGNRRFFGDKHWNEPLAWNKQAEAEGKKHLIFCASMADVFEAFDGLMMQRARLWELVDKTPSLEWLILTKRPENIVSMLPIGWPENPPSNVRIGITAEDQANANKRIPQLLKAWHGKNFISYEPAIGPLDLSGWLGECLDCDAYILDHRREGTIYHPENNLLHWVICGGESGAGCRPMDLEWARWIQDQCFEAGTPFFMKQLGGFPDKRHDPADWPEDLRIQQFPEAEQKGATK